MSFPVSFPSQLSSILEALLKAVVAEVTALVEDGAVELRLELRDRDRQILEKQRELEERDRVIEELRAAVEELSAREEAEDRRDREEAAVSPAEDGQEEAESCSREDNNKPFVKREPREGFAAASPDPHDSLWPPPPPLSTSDTPEPPVASAFDPKHQTAQTCPQYSQEPPDFPHMYPPDLPVDAFQNWSTEQFYSAQRPGFPLAPDPSPAQDGSRSKNVKKKGQNAKRPLRNFGSYRCNQCGKTFVAKCRLVTHQTVHTGVKPYSCEKCGKWFSRTDSLTRHQKKAGACAAPT